ncbi:hypothetical protein [Aeromonas sp. 604015]|uniref:hypothetical protein n=1 Tax=Aeromonas sp. 604015 TaxID=2712051 RepID=UPI003BA246EF
MFEVTANTVEDQLDEGVFRALVSVKGDQVVTNSRIIGGHLWKEPQERAASHSSARMQ